MSAGPDTQRFWHAITAFAGGVTLTWTLGAVLQLRHQIVGLALTELLCFALPAAVALCLGRARHPWRAGNDGLGTALPAGAGFAESPFRPPPLKAAVLSALLGTLMVVVAVSKGLAVRRALGAPLPVPPGPGLLWLALAVVAPLCEELLFRPVLQRGLASVWRPGTAVLATALLFGLTHGSIVQFPETLVLGLFGGVVFLKTRSYWASVLFHATANSFAPVLWGLVPRWGPLFHPVTAMFLTAVALFVAWQFELPRTERVWGMMKHVRWALFGTGTDVVRTGRAPTVAALVYWAGVLLMVGVIWGVRVAESATLRLAQAMIQVKQEDVWRLEANGVITARSRVYYARWPGRRESVSYALPYTEARVLKAEIAGRPAGVRIIGAGTFELVWPDRLPEAPRIVEAAWTMPLEALEDVARGYTARLQALVPVTGYALTLQLAPGSGYEFERAPERRETELFSMLDTGPAPRKSFGTCGVGLRRTSP